MGRIHGYGDKKDGEFVLFSGDLKGIGVADGQDLLGDKGDQIPILSDLKIPVEEIPFQIPVAVVDIILGYKKGKSLTYISYISSIKINFIFLKDGQDLLADDTDFLAGGLVKDPDPLSDGKEISPYKIPGCIVFAVDVI